MGPLKCLENIGKMRIFVINFELHYIIRNYIMKLFWN